MQTDGVVPLAAANDGRWPQMGMFDMLNLRINGYDFHVSLMGGNESWTDDKVKAVFTAWEELLPYYQPDVNGRTWQDAANGRRRQEAGMYPARHVRHAATSTADTQQDIIDDIDFFAFPSIAEEHGQDAVEAPIDGFMLAAEPANVDGAKALLTAMAVPRRSTPTSPSTRPSSPPTTARRPTATTPLQVKSAELVGAAKSSPSSSTATPTRTSPPTSSASRSPTSSPIPAASTRSCRPSRSRRARTPSSERHRRR